MKKILFVVCAIMMFVGMIVTPIAIGASSRTMLDCGMITTVLGFLGCMIGEPV